MKFSLPWPPSANHYWFLVACKGGGRKVLGKKGKIFREEVCELLGDLSPMEGRLSIEIEVYPPDRRKRDLDNLLKATFDAIEHAGVYEDDSQIDKIVVTREEVCKPGRLDINLKEIKK